MLTTLRENEWTDIHEIPNEVWTWDMEQAENFRDAVVNPLNPGSIFSISRIRVS